MGKPIERSLPSLRLKTSVGTQASKAIDDGIDAAILDYRSEGTQSIGFHGVSFRLRVNKIYSKGQIVVCPIG
jgi:hypothetical protein